MKRYDNEKIRTLNKRIEERLKRLNWDLSNRAETHHYLTEHSMPFEEEVKADDKNAVEALMKIAKLHEELFAAELELEIENKAKS